MKFSVLTTGILMMSLAVYCAAGCYYSPERDNPSDPRSPYRKISPPEGVKASRGDYKKCVRVTWEAEKGSDKYAVFRSETEGSGYGIIGKTEGLSMDDCETENMKKYYYRVLSYNKDEYYSDFSDSDEGYCYLQPVVVTASKEESLTTVTVTWGAIDEVVKYKVFRGESADGSFSELGETTGTTYADSSVSKGKMYYYRIKAYANDYSTSLSESAGGYIKLDTPIVESATNGSYTDRIKVVSNALAGATRYEIYRSTSIDGTYDKIGETETTTYNDMTAQGGVFYHYKVKAYSDPIKSWSDISTTSVKGIRICGSSFNVSYNGKTAKIEMREIPGGAFYMGDESVDYAEPVHLVSISNDFMMSRYEVTYDQWKTVRDWAIASGKGYSFGAGQCGSAGQTNMANPVVGISYIDAIIWCNALSEMTGRKPCYYTTSGLTSVFRSGSSWSLGPDCVYWLDNESKDAGYRLPTESEWEYACRAGTETHYFWGNMDDTGTVEKYAWYEESGSGMTSPVGQKAPNNFNLYDMAGNVWEWVFDLYQAPYQTTVSTDPHGPGATQDWTRVIRGGAYDSGKFNLMPAWRKEKSANASESKIGFRIVSSHVE